MTNFYEILGIKKNATEDGHYRKTPLKTIFDCNGGGWPKNQNT